MAEGDVDKPLFAVADLRAFLAGRWQLTRDLTDHRDGMAGDMMGHAVFAAEDDTLRYRETGAMRLGGYHGQAYQSYLYYFPQPAAAQIRFTDGRAFHALDLTDGVWQAVHHCGADTYEGRFRVLSFNLWEATWRIAGPRKDQRLSTRYRRDPTASS